MIAVRLPGRGSEPHIPVKALRHRLRLRVDESRPGELPAETLPDAADAFNRPLAEETGVDELLYRLHFASETVKPRLIAEPGVETEDALVFVHYLNDALTFAHGAGHRLFAPDVLAGFGRHYALHAVPVRRRADVHDIDARIVDKLDEIAVVPDLSPAVRLGLDETLPGADVIYVAQSDKARTFLGEVVCGTGDTAVPDKRARQLVRGRTRAPEHL